MTTPTTQTPAQQAAEQFREEIRAAFDLLHVEIAELRADLAQMREGLTHAAQPAPTVNTGDKVHSFIITRIEKEYSAKKKKNYYKVFGPEYPKHGVTIWDEVFASLGLNLEEMEWKEDYIFEIIPPMMVSGIKGEYTDKESGEIKIGIKKVIGKA